MTDNEFDDIINKKLQHYESDVPGDMWQRITGVKEKRRGGYIWYRYLVALLLLLLFFGMYKFNQNRNEKTVLDKIVHNNSGKKINDTANVYPGNNKNAVSTKDSLSITVPERKFNGEKGSELPYSNRKKGYNDDEPVVAGNIDEDKFQTGEQQTRKTGDTISGNSKTDTAVTKQLQKDTSISKTIEDNGNDSAGLNKDELYEKVALQFFVSPDLPFSSIHSSNSSYDKFLDDNISMKLSYTVGTAVKFAFSKRIHLLTGIQYSRVNENISGDSLADGYSTNHFSFINIPLIVSYTTTWTKSFHTSVKAGVLFNIASGYEGKMPDAFGSVNDISHGTYLSGTGLSFYTAINFSKPVSDKLNVFAEPYFRFQPKNIAEGSQQFTRKIQTAGLAAGVEFKFPGDRKND